jgi:hypothetical protein
MNRQAIADALFALVSAIPGFVTASTKLKHWADVPSSEQPALFQSQGAQTPLAPPAPGGARAWQLDFTLRIYVNTAGETDPTTVLNPFLDAITTLFDPNGIGAPQTLGSLVQWARIEGAIETFEGTLGDQEVALIPIRMLVA